MMEQDMQEILFTREEVTARIRDLAAQITRDYQGKSPAVIGILRGSFIFMVDLVRELNLPLTLDFMSASSYGSGTVSSGLVDIKLDTSEPITGRDVLLVEDILDSGLTLNFVKERLLSMEPASLKICTLLDKPERRRVDIYADYIGFTIPNEFVVGYGLDYKEFYRNLPFVGVLKPEVYSK